MYLYCEAYDSWSAGCDASYTGHCNTNSYRRVIKIQLTPEQARLLEAKHVGHDYDSSGDKPQRREHYEQIAPISLQEE